MAITDKEKGVWGLDQVYNKINQGSIWEYSGANAFYVWSKNNVGQLGQNNTTYYSSPVQISGSNWQSSSDTSSGTYNSSIAVKTDGTLWTWGYNDNGGLGQNAPTNSHLSSPTQIPGTTWSKVSMGNNSGAAIKTDGTLWAWGYNGNGNLGQNNNINYSSPAQIPGTTWNKIESGFRRTHAIKTDGTLWSWGYGNYGYFGNNTSGPSNRVSSPVQVPGTTWSEVHDAQYHVLGLKTDGTLWAWGYDGHGELAQNNNINYSSPAQIPGTTWSKVSSGLYSSAGIKTDGTLWTWGQTHKGQLGQNQTSVRYSSPVQIPGTTWSSIQVTEEYAMFALKTDNTLWSWGYNSNGNLGQNNRTEYSSPVQVGSDSDWVSIKAGSHGGLVAFRNL
jgi:YD repeat-containing protein